MNREEIFLAKDNVRIFKDGLYVNQKVFDTIKECNPNAICFVYDNLHSKQFKLTNLFNVLILALWQSSYVPYHDLAMYLWLNIGTNKSRVTSEDNLKKSKMNWLLRYKDQISDLYTPKLKDLIGVEHLIILPDNLEELFLADPYNILKQVFSLSYTTRVLFQTKGYCNMDSLKKDIYSFYKDFEKNLK